MRAPLAPVEAGEGKSPPEPPRSIDVDAERREPGGAFFRERVRVVALSGLARQPSQRDQSIVQRDAERAGHVVVAAACRAQVVWSARDEGIPRLAGKHRQAFEQIGYALVVQAVVAMLALRDDADERFRLEALEVRTGRGRRNVGDQGQLSGGARVA